MTEMNFPDILQSRCNNEEAELCVQLGGSGLIKIQYCIGVLLHTQPKLSAMLKGLYRSLKRHWRKAMKLIL
jgi:hypothetical protein